MDYEQKYTEDEKRYDLDEDFVIKIRDFPRHVLMSVLSLVHNNIDYIVGDEDMYTEIGGVIKGDNPFFFKIGYVFYYSETPILVNFEEISCDDFLDFIVDDSYFINLD